MRRRRWGRSRCSASPICSRAGFARFTKRLRSANCLFDCRADILICPQRTSKQDRQECLSYREGKKVMAEKAKAEKIVVEGAPRTTRGKNEARRLRQTGKVPAVLYGGKGQSITLAVN